MKKIFLEENMPLIKAAEANGELFNSIEAAQKLAGFYTFDDEEIEIVEVWYWQFNEFNEVVPMIFGYLCSPVDTLAGACFVSNEELKRRFVEA